MNNQLELLFMFCMTLHLQMQLLKGTDTSTLASGTSIMIWMLVLYLNRDNTAYVSYASLVLAATFQMHSQLGFVNNFFCGSICRLNEEIKGVANLASRLCP